MKKRIFSTDDARQFDRRAQEELGIPSLILMENAGRGVAEEAGSVKKIAIVCGTGNNGGDGLVAARHLLNAGKEVTVYLLGEPAKLKTDPLLNYQILRNLNANIVEVKSAADLKPVKQADLIIDAIFGIGLSTPVKSFLAEAIDLLNQTKIPILAVDVPSGLDADTGLILGTAVKANKTVTFVAAKKGFFKADGPKCCGKVIVRPIF